MSWFFLLCSANLFFAGSLSGIEIASHYGFVIEPHFLSEEDQVRLRQALILRLRVLVPAFFVPALISTIAIAALSVPGLDRALRMVALFGDMIWIYARIIATMRINSATTDWDPIAPPQGWRALVARAERFHIVSLWAVTFGFVCLLVASPAAA